MSQTFVVRGYADYLGTSYQLALCGANNVRWRDLVTGPVWGAAGRNVVELAEAAYAIEAARNAVRTFALLMKPDDWLFYIHMGHGTDEVPVLGPMGDVEGRAQGMVCNNSTFAKPTSFYTADLFEADVAGSLGNVAIIIDGCTCGWFVRDTVDPILLARATKKLVNGEVRYLPNPAWAGQRAFRDLPVVNMCPAGERICVLTACAEGESAPDMDAGGFSDLATAYIAAHPKLPVTACLMADVVGGELDKAIGNTPTASGPIADTAWPHVEN